MMAKVLIASSLLLKPACPLCADEVDDLREARKREEQKIQDQKREDKWVEQRRLDQKREDDRIYQKKIDDARWDAQHGR